jgi:glycerol transport system ATP-binding protein
LARITLDRLAHSYRPDPQGPAGLALKEVHHVWSQGGAYALLGPSGCGKTTLLNIISGWCARRAGASCSTSATYGPAHEARNIAQVFQFPVVYDTMTVRENLAFPLKNRGVPRETTARRVEEIAALLGLTPCSAARPAISPPT